MTIAVLSPYPERLENALLGDAFRVFEDISEVKDADLVVSYGHRNIIREPHLTMFAGRLINIHISFLPWNRGADPNFWSWYENTPKGVSIHHIDAGIDTGRLIAQKQVIFEPGHTLGTSYDRLQEEAAALFASTWPLIRAGDAASWAQPAGGSVHRVKDKAHLWPLPDGFNTLCETIARMGVESRASSAPVGSQGQA